MAFQLLNSIGYFDQRSSSKILIWLQGAGVILGLIIVIVMKIIQYIGHLIKALRGGIIYNQYYMLTSAV